MVYLCTCSRAFWRPNNTIAIGSSNPLAREHRSASASFWAGVNRFARSRSTNDEDVMPGYKSIDRIQTVTASTFDRLVLKGEGPIVVEFMSYGCAHCGVIEPDLQQVAEIVESTEKFFRVNIAVDRELSEQYEIQGTPTLIMFLNGAELGREEGPSPDVSNILAVVRQPYES